MKKSYKNNILKILENLEEFQDQIQNILGDEQESFDKKSEKWQESDKGSHSENVISELENASISIENLIEELTNSMEEYDE